VLNVVVLLTALGVKSGSN
ncbi:glutathione S-transferase, C-terminal domain protein, partial [Vibrio parahaemolyticus VPTS-2010_2]